MKQSRSRAGFCSAFSVLFEKFDGIADGQDRFGGIVGNLAAEFLFESHHELDGVETVGAKIVDKTRLLGHLVGFYSQVLHDDLFHPLANVTHRSNLVRFRFWAATGIVIATIAVRPRRGRRWRDGISNAEHNLLRLPPSAAPAGPRFGYHTSNRLTSACHSTRLTPAKPSISASYLRMIFPDNRSPSPIKSRINFSGSCAKTSPCHRSRAASAR